MLIHTRMVWWDELRAVPGDLGRLGFVPAGKEAAMEDAGVVKVLAEAFSRLASGGGAKALSSAGGNKKGGGVDELGAELKAVADKWGNLFQVRARAGCQCGRWHCPNTQC